MVPFDFFYDGESSLLSSLVAFSFFLGLLAREEIEEKPVLDLFVSLAL